MIELHPGDGVVLFTDGVTEAENTAGEHFGIERLCQSAQSRWSQSSEAIKSGIVADLLSHIGGQTVFDDITLIVVKQK